MRLVALLAVLLLLIGCAHASASPLQRYDALRPTLRSATSLAVTVSVDVNEINQGMRRDNRRWIRKVSSRLDRNAARLGRVAGTLHREVSAIRRDDDAGAVRAYFDLIMTAVSKQRYEGLWAGRLARTIRRDPLLVSPCTYDAAMRQSHFAARAAAASALAAADARSVRARNKASFRYVKVSLSPHAD